MKNASKDMRLHIKITQNNLNFIQILQECHQTIYKVTKWCNLFCIVFNTSPIQFFGCLNLLRHTTWKGKYLWLCGIMVHKWMYYSRYKTILQLGLSIEVQETNKKVWSLAESQDICGELSLLLVLYDLWNKLPRFCENGLLFWEKQKQLPLILDSISFANNNCMLDYNSYMIMIGPAKNRKIFSSFFQ